MTKPQLSVILAYKDHPAALQALDCLRSLQFQAISNFEVILVGPQKYPEFSGTWTHFSLKFIVFHGDKNQAKNIGIKVAVGPFILYLDHDMVASPDLLTNLLTLSKTYDAIIIPERGAGGNFWENCRKLEKSLIQYDIHTVTPRFYRKNLFTQAELPFDSQFGLLDEWGFNHALIKKNVSVGFSTGYLLVKESNLTLANEIANKFHRGYWMNNFSKIDSQEAWNRINPIKRGLVFYGSRLSYLFSEPIYFPGLLLLKFIDFASFVTGYGVGLIFNS